MSSPTTIIDSSTSSHIHSKHDDFLSLDTSASHLIKGFRGAQSCVIDHGTVLMSVQLPSGHQTCVKLKIHAMSLTHCQHYFLPLIWMKINFIPFLVMGDVFQFQWTMEVDLCIWLFQSQISALWEPEAQTDYTTLIHQPCLCRSMPSQLSTPPCQKSSSCWNRIM